MTAVLTVRPVHLRDITAALVPHAEDRHNGFTPTLQCICIDPARGAYAWATDRYSMARMSLGLMHGLEMPEEEMLIPAFILTILSRVGAGSLPADPVQYVIQIEELADRVVAKFVWRRDDHEDEVHWQRTWFLVGRYGDFPKVQRLFDEFVATEVAIPLVMDGPQVAKFSDYAKRMKSPIRFTGDNTTPSSPIFVEIGKEFRGMIAPFTPRGHFG